MEIRVVDSLITPPTVEPLDLDEIKKNLRFSSTSEDTLLDLWNSSARQHFERITGRQVLDALWERRLDTVPGCRGPIELPHAPLLEVVSFEYIALDGTLTSFSSGASPDEPYYDVEAPAGPYAERGRITPKYGYEWPTPRCEPGAVRIRYRAGWGTTPADVPELAKAALHGLVEHFHRRGFREDFPLSLLLFLRSFVSLERYPPRT